jgi:hypothetical protein
MTEISMDRVCELLRARGIPAYVEQTGGGVATIYAGKLEPVQEPVYRWAPEGGRERAGTTTVERWQAVAGPGWFEPGWQNPRADLSDFSIGPDDDGEAEPVYAAEDWDEEQVAEAIAKQVAA